jgi:hypothetical protein
MLGTYYYHEIIRKTIIGFGTLFNNIYIQHKDKSDQVLDETKVGIAYGPIQKFLAKIQQQAELNRAVAITLPRMSFEMTSIQYDSSRKSGVTQTFKASDGQNLKKVFMPVPYNIGFELNILTKLNDDALQIVEQILPYFQPSFTITIDLIDSIGEKKDIPIVLDSIDFQDDYEGDFSTRRSLIYTLRFTAKTYLFGPIADTTEGLIKKVQVDYYNDTNKEVAKRELRYVATPKAIKDYNNDDAAILSEDITKTETRLNVNTTSGLSENNRIVIDSEVMKVLEIVDSTTLIVKRGYDNTIISTHSQNTSIDLLTSEDDNLIDVDDDFGFNEETITFTDSRSYSPTRRIDI